VPVWHAPRRELKYLRTAGSAQYAEPCRAEVVQMSLSIGGTQACHRESHALHNAQGPGMSMARQRWHIDVAFRHSYARESKRDRAHLQVRARCPRHRFAPARKNVLIAHRRRWDPGDAFGRECKGYGRHGPTFDRHSARTRPKHCWMSSRPERKYPAWPARQWGGAREADGGRRRSQPCCGPVGTSRPRLASLHSFQHAFGTSQVDNTRSRRRHGESRSRPASGKEKSFSFFREKGEGGVSRG
jgi:hypothetical protein